MRERNTHILNFLFFIILLHIAAGFQSAFWPGFVRTLFGAQIWIYFSLYYFLNRNFVTGLLFCYVGSAMLTTYTTMSVGYILSLQIILLAFTHFIRSRIFWPTVSYFLILGGFSAFLFDLSYFVISRSFETMPMVHFSWRSTFSSLLFSPFFAFFTFYIGRSVDKLLPPPQVGLVET